MQRAYGSNILRGIGLLLFAASCLAWTAQFSHAATTEIASVSSDGVLGNGQSLTDAVSADGRFVAFTSNAGNLVPEDTNNHYDIFVHDRKTGTTERVSVSSAGDEGNGDSLHPSISSNGRFVSFHSYASNLVQGDTNGKSDVFIHDRVTGTTERVSVSSDGTEGNNYSWTSSVSDDGRYVAFYSQASNLVPGDTNNCPDVFVRDRAAGTTERVSVSSTGAQGNLNSDLPAISGNGRFVVFRSDSRTLVSDDTNGTYDIFVRDRALGTTERVSVSSTGTEGNNGAEGIPSITPDGRFVTFYASSTNLVPQGAGILVRDRQAGTTELASVNNAGEAANGDTQSPATISADGRFVAFASRATNLVSNDTNDQWDIFLRDRLNGTTERMSVSSDGTEQNGASAGSWISADGSAVVFQSLATNLVPGDTNGQMDIFVRNRSTIEITKALFDYVGDSLSVEATSTNGANDNLVIVNYGPMTWDPYRSLWFLDVQNVIAAPSAITVSGDSGSRIIQ